tara:strand:- start:84 stop:470 length:387 start_codon:yes stop_codon:yes gene_type:complete
MYSIASAESEAVTARTKAMSEISDNMRFLGFMMKGKTDFDLDSAKSAIENIVNLAAKAPALFEIETADPHAEAKPEIWSNFEDFVEKAITLQNVAIAASNSLVSEEDLKDVIIAMGKTCKSCHSLYRN